MEQFPMQPAKIITRNHKSIGIDAYSRDTLLMPNIIQIVANTQKLL